MLALPPVLPSPETSITRCCALLLLGHYFDKDGSAFAVVVTSKSRQAAHDTLKEGEGLETWRVWGSSADLATYFERRKQKVWQADARLIRQPEAWAALLRDKRSTWLYQTTVDTLT
ncbi:hypothetical protein VTK73DRAFT_1749 [Phialemonium thermophilum]|uniref:Uncharacterized protein n=1 Tax=Phialemonium thermophilum TaxID=223376 RepID=A0ABR3X7T4_9PEZI